MIPRPSLGDVITAALIEAGAVKSSERASVISALLAPLTAREQALEAELSVMTQAQQADSARGDIWQASAERLRVELKAAEAREQALREELAESYICEHAGTDCECMRAGEPSAPVGTPSAPTPEK